MSESKRHDASGWVRAAVVVVAVGLLGSACGDTRGKRIERQLDRCDRIVNETARVRCYEVLDD